MAEYLGSPLIANDAPRATWVQAKRCTISVWADVEGATFENPATKEQSASAWNERSVTVQGSPNGINWVDIDIMTDVSEDSIYQHFFGPFYYRVIGDDLTGIMASVVEGKS